MVLLGLLLPLTVLLVACVVRRHTDGWRDAGLLAGVVVGLGLVAVTEVAGALRAISAPLLVAVWGGACVGLLAAVRRWPPARPRLPSVSRELVLLASSVAALSALVLTLGVAIAPNNYDSLVYHLPRVAQWAQAGSIDHFPTWCARQLYSNPFAELVILHTYVLTGGDRLANAVQGAALVGAIVAVTSIARRTGLGWPGQTWAALFVATLPGAVVQGQTTQNDLVVGALLLTAGVFGLDVARGRIGVVQVVGWGGALGLACLTKGTALLLAPFLVVAPAVALGLKTGRRAALPVAFAALVAVMPNVGHWSRNLSTFGDPLVPASEYPFFRLESHTPAAVLSNIVRMGASHVEPPSWALARAVESSIRRAHDLVGVDADDPRTTFPGTRFEVRRWRPHEDQVTSPLHLLIALAAAVVVLLRGEHRAVRPVVVATALAMLTVAVLLKWQPWVCRLTLPITLGLAPIAAAVIEVRLGSRARGVVACALVLQAALALAVYPGRELMPRPRRAWPLSLPREEQYFTNYPGGLALLPVSAWLREHGVRRLGVVAQGDDIEFPLWSLLGPGVHIEHVSPWPELHRAHLRGAEQAPRDHVVCLHPALVAGLRALGWQLVFSAGDVTIWHP